MDGKTFVWSLKSGGKLGQQSRATKLAEGYEYIRRLVNDGEVILDIQEKPDKIVIQLEDK